MKHPFFVGHFDRNVRSFRPKVTKPIDLDKVRDILAAYCDKEQDGSLVIGESGKTHGEGDTEWLGRIEQEDVIARAGYLVCPWLLAGVNMTSIGFIRALHRSLGVDIFEPGDGVYLSPIQLAAIEGEWNPFKKASG